MDMFKIYMTCTKLMFDCSEQDIYHLLQNTKYINIFFLQNNKCQNTLLVKSPTPTEMEDKCSSFVQYSIFLITVSLGDGFQSAECPREILAEYQQIVIIDQSQNIKCPYSKLDICSNKALLAFPNGLTCSINNVSLSGMSMELTRN